MTLHRKTSFAALIALLVAAVVGTALLYGGVYNVAADDPHTRPVRALLETARKRSIAARAGNLQVPVDLDAPERIRRGAGNYDAMCSGCHLAPGMAATELSRGLYPAPPVLARERLPAAETFWIIKHGIKATGMPAWGRSMSDEHVWNLVAFLQSLPTLDKAQYAALVAGSGGHSHGGGETMPHHGGQDAMPAGGGLDDAMAMDGMAHGEGDAHPHGANTAADHHAAAQAAPAPGKAASPPASKQNAAKPATNAVEHRHADGTVESHPAPTADPPADGHPADHHP